MNLHFLGALCFLPILFTNNLIFNNIDFRYRFAFDHYLHFFSITFPDSRFVALQGALSPPPKSNLARKAGGIMWPTAPAA